MSEYAIISQVPMQTIGDPETGELSPMMQVWYVELPNYVFAPYETDGVGIAGTPDEIANEVANYLSDLCEEEEI
jgi:hypothetical protein